MAKKITSNKQKLKQILNFIHEAEKLKELLRHSWLSNGRQESVAEHSWRLGLMALLLEPELEKKIDLERVLKMIIIHDLGEIYAGDHPAFKDKLSNKYELEKEGVLKLVKKLPEETRNEIIDLWKEYEKCETEEAKFVKALDKMEVLIQHNESDIRTWEPKEYSFNLYHGDEYCEYSNVLKQLRDIIREETREKIEKEAEEYFDLVDENNKPIGKRKLRVFVHSDGDWHRSTHVWILNKDNQILCHKRSENKDTFPNHWDMVCGGHVSSGDDYDSTAIRELEEESEIKTTIDKLIPLKITKIEIFDKNTNTVDREFQKEFIYFLKGEDRIRFNKDEITEIKWMRIPEIKKVLKSETPEINFIPKKEYYLGMLKIIENHLEKT